MQSICLEGYGGENAVDPRLQDTTFIQHTFGGSLRSKVLNLLVTFQFSGCPFTLNNSMTPYEIGEMLEMPPRIREVRENDGSYPRDIRLG